MDMQNSDSFEIAAPEIGEAVSRRKKLETFAKDVGTKSVRKQLEGEKRNPSVVLEAPFLKKVVRKPIALAKTFLTKQNEYKSN